ncbi:hypothetical protein ACIRYZ_06750 [Kitasatospora sp. NPDC101155]|uniref:hypothetical protein n=1 Tax=Kitasatospora sp. NPDC101155 TaxID=3364097 RepID=UPI00382A2288
MTDLDFERRVNPWLFDSSGNLTEAAKKQFPDLAAAAAGAQPQGWSPEPVTGASGGGPTVKVSPEALRRAATNADTLHTKFDKASRDIWTNNPHPTEDVTGSWAIVKAIEGMGQIWGGQVSATSQMMQDISRTSSTN